MMMIMMMMIMMMMIYTAANTDNDNDYDSTWLQLVSLSPKVTVTDENGKVYKFPCKEWLSETQGGGKTERLLRLSNS